MKGDILEANCEKKDGKQDCLPFCWFYTGSSDILKERGVNRIRLAEFRKLSCLGAGSKWLTLGKKGFAWETRNSEKLYRLTIKRTSSKTVAIGFSYNLRVLSTDRFKSIVSRKKCTFLKN